MRFPRIRGFSLKQVFVLLLLLSLLVSSGCATASGRPWGFMDPEEDTFEAESIFPFEGSGSKRSSGIVNGSNWGLGWFSDAGRDSHGESFWLNTPNLSARDAEAAAFFLFILPHLLIHIKN